MRTPANSGSGRIPFQSTPSAWRETIRTQAPSLRRVISIHSLRMEGDNRRFRAIRDPTTFQSTPSAWRETRQCWLSTIGELFQSTPSAWRETRLRVTTIYTLSHFNPLPPHGGRLTIPMFFFVPETFQSTPSAWRETFLPFLNTPTIRISIHSLRMEGDGEKIGDSVGNILIFQSTPSAWRET